MNNTAETTIIRGELVGISVCPKCQIINKIRTTDDIYDNKCKCHSCGEEISIDKKMKK